MIAHSVEKGLTDDASPLVSCGEGEQEHERSFGMSDPTAYLFQSEANRKRLLTAIENINAGRNLVEILSASNHANV